MVESRSARHVDARLDVVWSASAEVLGQFTGPLVGPMSSRMIDLQPSYDRFADGIKARCERRS